MNDYFEIIYAMGAMLIFSMLLVSANGYIVQNQKFRVESEFEYAALGIAESIISEARSKAFDHNVATGEGVNEPQDLTPTDDLGPASGEGYPDFNDFDDFIAYPDTVTTDHGAFVVDVNVYYVRMNEPDSPIGERTWHKRMDVTVDSRYMDTSARMSYIRSFYQN